MTLMSERLRIELSLLLGGYPPTFITEQFLRFFQVHKTMPVRQSLNQTVYRQLRQQLIHLTDRKRTKNYNESMPDPVRISKNITTKKYGIVQSCIQDIS